MCICVSVYKSIEIKVVKKYYEISKNLKVYINKFVNIIFKV